MKYKGFAVKTLGTFSFFNGDDSEQKLIGYPFIFGVLRVSFAEAQEMVRN